MGNLLQNWTQAKSVRIRPRDIKPKLMINLTKTEIVDMLRDLKACEVAVTYFEKRSLTPRQYWDRKEYGCAWLIGSPATIDRLRADRPMSYEEAIETLIAEWLVRTQCPDYWRAYVSPPPQLRDEICAYEGKPQRRTP